MATDTRSGFRLPWGSDSGGPGDQSSNDVTPGVEESQETPMIETAALSESPTTPEPVASVETPPEHHAVEVDSAAPSTRRATTFMVELSRAMQAAVEKARTETMARFEVEAKTVVDEIQSGASSEAANIRSRADGDVSAIRDWSKAEIARVREETESRIAARKAALDDELVEQAATIETRTARIAGVVATYEADLAAFFERLNAEEDPTRIATMAEAMPEPPSLADVAAAVASPSEPSAERFARLFAASDEPDAPEAVDFAAAEAEAASLAGDLESEDDVPLSDAEPPETASIEDAVADIEVATAEPGTTRVVVSGLVSVANIANFKRGLGRLAGVSSIAVASGRDGDFAFTVGHTLGSALAESVRTLPGFDVEVNSESDGAIVVAAKDRDSNG
jgi:hypothetical protein